MTAVPPEWVAKLFASFNAISGWACLVFALFGTILWLAPVPDLAQFKYDWIPLLTILCWLALTAKLGLRADQFVRRFWQDRSRKRAALAHLETLSPAELRILCGCLARGERTHVGSLMNDEDHAAASALCSKGLLEQSASGLTFVGAIPYTIPGFVWKKLLFICARIELP